RDCSGNVSGTVSQTITVQDTTDPVLSGCPTETQITVDCLADVPAAPEVTATDACQGSVEVVFSQTSSNENECGPNCGGVITRTWTATDCSGNSTSCTQVITYGNPAPDLASIAALLTSGDIVVGVSGTRSLTIPGGKKAGSSARCIVSKLA